MANHRAPRRSTSRTGTTDGTHTTPLEPIGESVPRAAGSGGPGKRKAVKPSRLRRTRSTAPQTAPAPTPAPGGRAGRRKPAIPLLPSAPAAVGVAALVIAATGAATAANTGGDTIAAAPSVKPFSPANAFTGTTKDTSSTVLRSRQEAVSRDSQRKALEDAADEELQAAVEAQAEERNAALAQLAASAEKYAGEIAANAWQLPLASYRLTASFGQASGLWSSTHTGLDFAAPTGTPVMSVARGTVRSTDYAGAYGNRVVVALEDGTEVWFCHLNSFSVSPGQTVDGGQQVGTVGMTGNTTGSHLHLEVRPGAGDPVDPYAALRARGLQP